MEDEIFIRWCSAGAASPTGVRRVRVIKKAKFNYTWKDIERWKFYADHDVFEDKDAAIEDGERRRQERRETLQRQLDKLNKPMRVSEKLKVRDEQ